MTSEPESSRRGILIDIDGTLTNANREITPVTQVALQLLAHSNFKSGVSTGRHYAAIKNYVLPHFSKSSLHITAGGGQIVNSEGQVTWEELIPQKDAVEIIRTVESLGGEVCFGKNQTLYCSPLMLNNLKRHPWNIQVSSIKEAGQITTPLISVVNLNSQLKEYIASLQNVSAVLMGENPKSQYYDITALNVNKATAAHIWADQSGIDLQDTIAVGDGANDIKLFEVVGQSVAMGQAPKNVKEKAKLTIGHIDENGLAILIWQLCGLRYEDSD